MTPQQFEDELRKTFTDQKLSRTEKRALKELVASTEPHELALLRSIAFDVARGELGESLAVDWLEEVVKVLIPASDEAPPSSGAFFSPGDEPLRKLLSLLGSARESVDICVFTITDNRITGAIIDCHRRGVRVRVLSDDDKAFDRGSDIHRLKETGISVRTDHGSQHMHHKFAIFDRRELVTGSYNWTRSAASANYENIIVTGDPRLLGPFNDLFGRLWDDLQ